MMMIKERIENYGTKSLFDHEVIHMLTGIPMESLADFKNLDELRIGYHKAKLTKVQKNKLELFFELNSRMNKKVGIRNKVSSTEEIYNLVKWDIAYKDKEIFLIIMLDAQARLIDVTKISEGSLTASIVHPREVFKPAIMRSAYSIVGVHNHPSNDTTPSKEDILITNRLVGAGDILGIKFIDHVIVGRDGYTSMKEARHM